MKGFIEVLLAFLRLGATGFGGPLALVAQMQIDFIERRGWIPADEFQKAFTLIKSMPGAVAFNCAVYLGRRRAGLPGAFAAALGLLAPSFFLILAFAAIYPTMRDSEVLRKVLLGTQAAALALIVAALKPLTGRFFKQPTFWILAFMGGLLFASKQIPEPILIVGGGLLVLLARRRFGSAALVVALPDPSLIPRLFWICFKAGAFVFGSGIAIAPLLERDFVQSLGWVTHSEFMDALAIGQVTPGPFLLTTTFLGHKVAGVPGALVATTGVFLAGFIHMVTWFPAAVNRLSKMKWIDDFLFGALAMVTGTIVVTVIILASEWTSQPMLFVVTGLALIAALMTRIPSWALILAGGGAALVLL